MKIPFILWMNILKLKNVKFIFIRSKLGFESLAHKLFVHLCLFFLVTTDLYSCCNYMNVPIFVCYAVM